MCSYPRLSRVGRCQEEWPSLPGTLLQTIEAGPEACVKGALVAFQLLCEDHSNQFCNPSMSETLNMMIVRFISLFASADAEIRTNAINCLRRFILVLPPALLVNLQAFLQVTFQRTPVLLHPQ